MRPFDSSVANPASATRSAYAMLGALWFFQLVNYLDRTAMAFAGPVIMKSLAIGPEQFGLILSSFGIGYVLAQLPGGILSDRFGARIVLAIAPLFWALFTGVLGAVSTLIGFILVRICFGAAEGISNGACFKVIGDTFDQEERPRASALWFTSYAIGPAIAGPAIGMLLTSVGWRYTFVALAVPAIVAAAVNWRMMPKPSRSAVRIRSIEPTATIPLSQLARLPSLWMLALTFFAFNFGYWGFLGWMPTYLATAHHLDLKAMGMLGGVPYLAGVAGLLAVGWLATTRFSQYRGQLVASCFILAGGTLFVAFIAPNLAATMIGLSATAFLIYGGLSLMSTVMLDAAPSTSRATYMSIITTAGHLGTIIAPTAIGYTVSVTGGFAGGFSLMIAGLVVAGACVLSVVGMERARRDAKALT